MQTSQGRVLLLGASGTSGRLIAAELAERKIPTILVGRNLEKLNEVARDIQAKFGTLPATLLWPTSELPAAVGVIINAAGPFSKTTPDAIAAALNHGIHCIDIADDLPAVRYVLAHSTQAIARGSTLLTAAGFGAIAGDAAVRVASSNLGLPPVSVEVAVFPESRFSTGGALQSVLEVLPKGVQIYRKGRLRSILPGSNQRTIQLPTGQKKVIPIPLGELIAAQRATEAPDVISYSGSLPGGLMTRIALPIARTIFAISPLRTFVIKRVARQEVKEIKIEGATPSKAWARVTSANGKSAESFWEFPEGYEFTARSSVECAERLLRNQGRPGAYLPGELFGTDVAITAGGQTISLTSRSTHQ